MSERDEGEAERHMPAAVCRLLLPTALPAAFSDCFAAAATITASYAGEATLNRDTQTKHNSTPPHTCAHIQHNQTTTPTRHFFYNSPDLDFLVALQAALTVAGNCTCWLAAYRIYRAAKA